MASTRDLIGPALPPHFARSAPEADPDGDACQGPALPPDYKSNSEKCACDQERTSLHAPKEMDSDSEDDQDSSPTSRKRIRYQEDDDDDDGFFGPALPPGFKKQDESPDRPIIGPALPPGFKKQSEDAEENTVPSVSSQFTIQATDSSEEEEIIIGPIPSKGPVESSISAEIEHRSRRMKAKLLGEDDDGSKSIKRETWMTELPPELKGFGLGPRTFKRRTDDKSGDRSIWTDTPADREKKAKEMQDAKKSISKGDTEILLSERDKRLAEQVSSYNECQRSESLMDIHHKKLKSKANQEKNKPQERRPFDRDQDLHVHQFDEAQKKALIKRSRDLNTRFSHSKCNMFL
ncbi:GPALPP motifs-containing protein 1 [Tiliqua scincoides]|uniref:GPALPP motifs-containing protein 1 n=1 Tax=Tiliqua scincoides TaxID=71010 RepID=UPI00346184B8